MAGIFGTKEMHGRSHSAKAGNPLWIRNWFLGLGLVLGIGTAAANFFMGVSAQTVTVQPGDSLASIARNELGRGSAWRDLCDANKEVLGEDCDLIRPGMVLRLPETGSGVGTDVPVSEQGADVANAEVVEDAGDAFGDADILPNSAETSDGTLSGLPAAEANASEGSADEGDAVDSDQRTVPEGTAGANQARPDVVRVRVPLRFNAANGYKVEAGERGGVRLSGHVPNAPSAGLPGIYVQVPPALEVAVSGRTIAIAIAVFSSKPTIAGLAYSTNEVGNSGWRRIQAGPNSPASIIRYEVPMLRDGNGDFIGIIPDPNNTGQAVEVLAIEVIYRR